MTDEMFPNVPLIPKRVATSHTIGGRCAHCEMRLAYGRPVHKLAPACCNTHRIPLVVGADNGPGRWVCTTCLEQLT